MNFHTKLEKAKELKPVIINYNPETVTNNCIDIGMTYDVLFPKYVSVQNRTIHIVCDSLATTIHCIITGDGEYIFPTNFYPTIDTQSDKLVSFEEVYNAKTKESLPQLNTIFKGLYKNFIASSQQEKAKRLQEIIKMFQEAYDISGEEYNWAEEV